MKKIISFSITALFLAVPIIVFSIPWNNIETINAAGSSAVQPLMAKISNVYQKADLVTQAGGSGAGIKLIANSQKDIGMASKNPKIVGLGSEKADPVLKKKWENKQIKTITIAWDGLGIIYKPGTDEDKDRIFDINETNIIDIYKAFAGYEFFSFSEIPNSKLKSNQKIKTYARSGGSKVSGTADAFFKDSNLKSNKKLDEKEKKALSDGSYGPYTITTNESNSQVFSYVKDFGPGTMTYLSAGYILNNIKEITQAGFKVATYKGINIEDGKITNGFNWFRPLNLMVSLARLEDKVKNLIDEILSSSILIDIIRKDGYIPLTTKQIESMNGVNGKRWDKTKSSDVALEYCGAKP